MSADIRTDEIVRATAIWRLKNVGELKNHLRWFKDNPQQFSDRVNTFDAVIGEMNRLLTQDLDASFDEERHRDLIKLKTVVGEDRLPELANLPKDEVDSVFVDIRESFGEKWSWVQGLSANEAASGLLVEGYGLLLANRFRLPNGDSNRDLKRAFVLSFEAILMTNHTDSGLFKDVRSWMIEERNDFPPAVAKQL